jgi:hypothetical protein
MWASVCWSDSARISRVRVRRVQHKVLDKREFIAAAPPLRLFDFALRMKHVSAFR